MHEEPDFDPLGSCPVLPSPSPKRLEEAVRLLERLKAKKGLDTDIHAEIAASAPTSSTEPLILPCPPLVSPARFAPQPKPTTQTKPIARTYPASRWQQRARIRSGVIKKNKTPVSQQSLENMSLAGGRFQHTQVGAGRHAVEMKLPDSILDAVECELSMQSDGLHATFIAKDVNVKRLLEAEKGSLLRGLEKRGIRVAEVKVEMPPAG